MASYNFPSGFQSWNRYNLWKSSLYPKFMRYINEKELKQSWLPVNSTDVPQTRAAEDDLSLLI